MFWQNSESLVFFLISLSEFLSFFSFFCSIFLAWRSTDSKRDAIVRVFKDCGATNTCFINSKESGGKFHLSRVNNANFRRYLSKFKLSHFQTIFPDDPNLSSGFFRLFQLIKELLDIANSWMPSAAQIARYGEAAEEFRRLWVGSPPGVQPRVRALFGPSKFTPYCHHIVFHVHQVLKKYGNILPFACYAMEYNNSRNKKYYWNTNKRDATALVQVMQRILRVTFNPFCDFFPFHCPVDSCRFASSSESGITRHVLHSHPDSEEAEDEEDWLPEDEDDSEEDDDDDDDDDDDEDNDSGVEADSEQLTVENDDDDDDDEVSFSRQDAWQLLDNSSA